MTFTLDPIYKEQWIKALRSGEYEQGKGQLKDGANKFCCLGVLQQIVMGEVKENALYLDDTCIRKVNWPENIAYNKNTCHVQTFLSNLNDSGVFNKDTGYWETLDFNQIADWIEENL